MRITEGWTLVSITEGKALTRTTEGWTLIRITEGKPVTRTTEGWTLMCITEGKPLHAYHWGLDPHVHLGGLHPPAQPRGPDPHAVQQQPLLAILLPVRGPQTCTKCSPWTLGYWSAPMHRSLRARIGAHTRMRRGASSEQNRIHRGWCPVASFQFRACQGSVDGQKHLPNTFTPNSRTNNEQPTTVFRSRCNA
jgi:hypothetical protein